MFKGVRNWYCRFVTRRRLLTLLIGVSGPWLVLLWQCFKPMTPLSISVETTRVTGPLTADGEYVDYLKLLKERVEASDAKPASKDPWCILTDRNMVGLLPIAANAPRYFEFTNYFRKWLSEHDDYEADGTRLLMSEFSNPVDVYRFPFATDPHPAIDEFLSANAAWFNAIGTEAPTPPSLEFGRSVSVPSADQVLLHRGQNYRFIADRIGIRAALKFQACDSDAALRDVRIMFRAADGCEEFCLIGRAISAYVYTNTCEVVIGGLAIGESLSDANYQWLLALPVDSGLFEDIAASVDTTERWVQLDYIQHMRWDFISDVGPLLELPRGLETMGASYAVRRVDFSQLMRDHNAELDRVVEALRCSTYREQRDRLADTTSVTPPLPGAYPGFSLGFFSFDFHATTAAGIGTGFNMDRIPSMKASQLNARRVLHLATRLSLWKKLHASYPESLADVLTIPGWPNAPDGVLTDAFSDAPFGYKSDGKSYLIRSAGEDMLLGEPNHLDDVRWPAVIPAKNAP